MRKLLLSMVLIAVLAGLITSTAEAPADYKEISRESSEFKGLRPDLKAMAGNNDATSRLRARVNASYGKLPLYFIRNEGQVDRRANFYAKTRNYMLWFTENGLVFDKVLSEGKRNNKADSPELKKESRSGKFKRDISRLEFAGVNKKTLLNGVQEQEHRANYFKGNDRSKWKTAIKTFAEVQYNNIYDHIDLKVYGVENQIEYDWEVLPGGKPSDIRFRYKGVKKTEITKDGDLLVKTSFGELFHKKPVAFQEINGEKVAIAASFKMTGRDRYGIEVGAYDKTRKLIIDPLIYSTYLDGSDMDSSDCIVVDGSGNAYVTGYTDSTDFPTTAGAYDTSYNGWREGFITKINASGTALVYSTYLGGSGPDHPSSIAIDSSGNAYVTGHTGSIDFPTTVGAYDTSHNGKTYDTFITKLNASGTALVYSTYLGGSGDDYTSSITLDGSGNAYVTGSTDSNDFPATAGAYETSYIYNGWREGFITKLNASGTALVYSTYLGGNGEDWIYSIALDHSGNAYVTGGTYSTDFPTTSGAYDTSYNGGRSAAFITKLNATGTTLVYSTYLEGSSYDSGYSIALDGSGNAYVTGNTYSTDFPVTPGTYGTSFNGETEGFITKLNASGTTLLYSTYLGGNGSDFIACIVIDSSGNACVTGETISTDFPVTPGAYDTIFNGGRDGFITKLNASGTALVYSTYLGGSGHDSGTGIALDGSGNAYVTGSTNSTDFPTTAGAYDTSYNGGEFGVGFIIKLNFALSSITLTSPNGGENWNSGTIHNITWSSGGTIANVNIDYSANIGSSWTSVAAGTANDGTYAWTVPAITPSANCLVRISDASNAATNDVSDSVFSISSAATETVSTPSQPSGANSGLKATSYPFTTGGSTSNLGHSIQYKFDWDDGSDSGWLAVGTTTAAHSWSAAGSYDVRAMARCAEHTTVESIWSPTLSVIITDGVTTGHYNSPAQYKVLPEVIWAPATGGGTWMSNVQVTDVSGGSQVSVYYNAASGRRGPFLLWDNSGGGALSSVKYTNLLQTIDGLDSGAFTYYGTVGAVEFISQDGSHLLQAAARTLNGNYAKTFTALSLHDANTATTSRAMIVANLSNNVSYRSTGGFFNPTGEAVTVEFMLLDGSGGQIGAQFSKTLAGHDFQAFNPFIQAGVPYPGNAYGNAILRVRPTAGAGQVMCFGASVDNTSNDPAAHVAVQGATGYDNGPGSQQILPEVIWSSATGGGTWMSNVQVTDVSGGSQVSVYYNAASGRRGPFLLWDNSGGGALSSVKYANLLETIDGLDTEVFTYYGTVGAVEFVSQDGSHLLQAAARTLNGNYAKTLSGLNLVEAETADTSRVMLIQNYTNNSSYRSTCGFYNPTADAVTVEFTLLNSSGAQIGTPFSKTLAGHDFQAFNPFIQAGVPYPGNAYDNIILRVRPTSGAGNVMCFGATVDNTSNDPAAHVAVQAQ